MEKSPTTYSEIINDGALRDMAELLAKSECENLKLRKLLKEATDSLSKKNNDTYMTSEVVSDYRIELHD